MFVTQVSSGSIKSLLFASSINSTLDFILTFSEIIYLKLFLLTG